MNETGEPPLILHATTIAFRSGGYWRGVLIQGQSGVGKSDLALRAVSCGWSLIADDRTLVWASGGSVFGRAPPRLRGLVEARGLGVVPIQTRFMAELALVVLCVSSPQALERIPAIERRQVLNATLPCINLFACEASALAKLALALQGSGPPL